MAATKVDVPLTLRRAHDEVMLALCADTDADAAVHRAIADGYVRDAVQTIRDTPGVAYDWSGLQSLG